MIFSTVPGRVVLGFSLIGLLKEIGFHRLTTTLGYSAMQNTLRRGYRGFNFSSRLISWRHTSS